MLLYFVPVTVGCAKCTFGKETGAQECGVAAKSGECVFILKGEPVQREFPGACAKKGGPYVVKGVVSDDGRSLDVAVLSREQRSESQGKS